MGEVEGPTGIQSWEKLARDLQRERRAPECGQPVTEVVKEALARLGFTWDEWCKLWLISRSGVAAFHQGSRGYETALRALDEVPLPADLTSAAECKAAAKKAILYLRDNAEVL
jgi:hypothetical protein